MTSIAVLTCLTCGQRARREVSPGVWKCSFCESQKAQTAVARTNDPETSWEAAQSLGNLRDSQKQVLSLLIYPMTDEQIADAAELAGVHQSPSGLRTRREELETLGLVRWTGRHGLTKANRKTRIWERI